MGALSRFFCLAIDFRVILLVVIRWLTTISHLVVYQYCKQTQGNMYIDLFNVEWVRNIFLFVKITSSMGIIYRVVWSKVHCDETTGINHKFLLLFSFFILQLSFGFVSGWSRFCPKCWEWIQGGILGEEMRNCNFNPLEYFCSKINDKTWSDNKENVMMSLVWLTWTVDLW